MNSKLKRLEKSRAEVEVSLTSEEMKKFEDLAIAKLTKTMHIEGYRDGYLTEETVREKGDKKQIEDATITEAINGTLTEVVVKERVFPISQPEIEIKNKNPLEYIAIFDATPDVKIGDYKKHALSKSEIKISDDEINEQIDMFRGQVAETKEVDREVKKGDIVNINFEGFDMDGNPVPNTKSDNFDMEIGSGKMIPGFEEEAIGMKKGDEKEFTITFPKEYHAPQMAGKDFKFKIKINSVSEKILPELDEKFVEKITGAKKSVEDFKNEIKTHLITKKEKDQLKLLEDEFLAKVLDNTDFEVAESDVKMELERMIDGMKMQGLQMGKPWEKYLEEMGKTEEDFKKDFEPMAIDNIKKRYIVQEIIQAEEIRISDEIIEAEIKKYAEDAKKVGKNFNEADYQKGGRQFETLRNHFAIEEMFRRVIK